MYKRLFILLHRFRFLIIVPLIVVADLFLMSLLPAVIGKDNAAKVHAQNTNASAAALDSSAYNTPNLVTSGLATAATNIKATTFTVGLTVGRVSGTILHATGTAIATSSVFVARGVFSGVTFVASSVGKSVAFMFHAPGNVLDYVSDKATASAIARPTEHDKIPVINPNAAAVMAAHAPVPTLEESESAPVNTEAVWPIHGNITTQFGVPHWPYQPTHTGLDISSGHSSGATPVIPFKPGRVIEAIRSSVGLGNHVVVDHGDGITSVYGHLYSISVQAGQDVTQATTLGFEGSTGASTGTHLHFEIRLNGQSVNPKPYINSPL